jgi:hypothetical protein
MKRCATLALAAFGFTGLCAQGTHFGMQVGGVIPQGDAQTAVGSAKGYLVGLNVNFDGSSGFTFRPSLTYSSTQGTGPSGLSIIYYTYQDRVSTALLSFDAIYHVNQSPDGVYLLGGIGAADTKLEVSDGPQGSQGKDGVGFSWGLGLGWQSRSLLGLELCYRSTKPKLTNDAYYQTLNQSTFDASALTAAVTFKF